LFFFGKCSKIGCVYFTVGDCLLQVPLKMKIKGD
jgi:hypothetical protein